AKTISFWRPVCCIADQRCQAIPLCRFQAATVPCQSYDGNLRTAQARHDRTKNPDGSRTKDDHAIAGPNSRVLDYGIVGHTAGFGKACHFKGEAVRNMMQTTRGHTHIAGHRAVDAISKPLTRWVKVIEATPRHRVIRVNHGSRLADNTVALFPAFHSGAG